MSDHPITLLWLRPGTADRYACENCLRDRDLTTQWTRLGITIHSAAAYLPLAEAPHGPIFYGALRTWLGTRKPGLRNLPSVINRVMDNPRLLTWLAGLARTTDPQQGAALTEAMLTGNYDPRLDEELLRHVKQHAQKTTRVLISTPLLARQGRRLAAALNCPWYSLLGGEEHWVEALGGSMPQRIWDLLRAESLSCAAFVRYQSEIHPLIHQHIQPNVIIDATELHTHGYANEKGQPR